MSVRTKLILIFLGLSVVPLALLTFISYSNSLESLKKLVERDNRAAAAELQARVGNMNAEIRDRVAAITELPEFEAIDFSERLSRDDADRLARAMRREVGDQWEVLADLKFEAERPPAPEPAPLPVLVAQAPPPPGASGVETGAVAPAGEDDGDSYTMKIILPDFSQLLSDAEHVPELKQYELDFVEGAPTEETMHQIASEMEDMMENLSFLSGFFVETGGDGRTIKLRNLGDDVQSALLEIETDDAGVEANNLETRRRRLAILERLDQATLESAQPITLPVVRDGAPVGNVIAHVRPERMLSEVFRGTTLEEGEIVFAVDPLGRLHTRQHDDLTTLRQLGLAGKEASPQPGGPPAAMAVARDPAAALNDPDWISVIEKDEDTGYTFGIVRRVATEIDSIEQATVMNLFLGFAFIGLAGSGVIVFSRRMTRGLELLADGAHRIAGGDLHFRLDARRKDEIGQLAVAFNDMAADLDASRDRLVVQERLQRDLEIARGIQRDSLPRGGFTGEGVEISGRSIPSLEVGGDFFNFLPVPGGRTAILVGDVSGKGVPAALMMAEVQATFRTLLRYQDDPARIIAQMNQDLAGNKPANAYFTVFLGVVDPRAGTLTYVNAAQTPPFLMRRDGQVIYLGSNSRPVGLFADSPVASETVRVERGDLLCSYTDGVVESAASEAAEEFFGEERLVEAVRTALDRPLDDVIAEVAGRLTGFHGEGAFEDDATLVVARFAPEQRGKQPVPPGDVASTQDEGLPVV